MNDNKYSKPLLCEVCDTPMIRIKTERSPRGSGSSVGLDQELDGETQQITYSGGTAPIYVNSTGVNRSESSWHIYKCPNCGNQISSERLFKDPE